MGSDRLVGHKSVLLRVKTTHLLGVHDEAPQMRLVAVAVSLLELRNQVCVRILVEGVETEQLEVLFVQVLDAHPA